MAHSHLNFFNRIENGLRTVPLINCIWAVWTGHKGISPYEALLVLLFSKLNSGQKSNLYFSHFERNFATFWINGYIFSQKLFLYFLGRLSNEMQSTFHKTLTNAIKKIFKKVATKWTFILLCIYRWHRPQFERFLKDFFDEHERHLAENVHAFCVIL